MGARRAREACRKVRISDAREIEGMFILLQIHSLFFCGIKSLLQRRLRAEALMITANMSTTAL
jgi:hypothetical protein